MHATNKVVHSAVQCKKSNIFEVQHKITYMMISKYDVCSKLRLIYLPCWILHASKQIKYKEHVDFVDKVIF